MPRVFSAGGGNYGAMGRQHRRYRELPDGDAVVGAAPRKPRAGAAGGSGMAEGTPKGKGGAGGKGQAGAAAVGKGGKGGGEPWNCTVCGYYNFADRTACLRCAKIAAAAAPKGKGKATCPAGRVLGGGKAAGKGKGEHVGKGGPWNGVIPAGSKPDGERELRRELAAAQQTIKKLERERGQPAQEPEVGAAAAGDAAEPKEESDQDRQVARLHVRKKDLSEQMQHLEHLLAEHRKFLKKLAKDGDAAMDDAAADALKEQLEHTKAEHAGVREELQELKPRKKQLAEAKADVKRAEDKLQGFEQRLEKGHKAAAAAAKEVDTASELVARQRRLASEAADKLAALEQQGGDEDDDEEEDDTGFADADDGSGDNAALLGWLELEGAESIIGMAPGPLQDGLRKAMQHMVQGKAPTAAAARQPVAPPPAAAAASDRKLGLLASNAKAPGAPPPKAAPVPAKAGAAQGSGDIAEMAVEGEGAADAPADDSVSGEAMPAKKGRGGVAGA